MTERQEIIEAMLEFDHLGFQTSADRRNFVQCLKSAQNDIGMCQDYMNMLQQCEKDNRGYN